MRLWLPAGLLVALASAALYLTVFAPGADHYPAAAPELEIWRLLDDVEVAEIHSSFRPLAGAEDGLPSVEGLTPVLAADFSEPAGALVYRQPEPFLPGRSDLLPGTEIPVPAAPRRCAEAALGDGLGLRFDAPSGAVFWVVPATPDTPYLFSASVRRSATPVPRDGSARPAPGDLRPDIPPDSPLARSALVGRILLVELHEVPPEVGPEDDVRDTLRRALETSPSQHALPIAAPDGEFDRGVRLFKSSVYTKAMLVALVAGNPGWWLRPDAGGSGAEPPPTPVDFDEISLFPLPLRRYLPAQPLSAQDDLGPGAPPGEREAGTALAFRRKVKLTADVRRSLLAAPPTEAAFEVVLPDGPFRLTWSAGVLEERRASWGETPIRFLATLTRNSSAPELLAEQTLTPASATNQRGWHEFAYEGLGSGELAEIRFSTSSPSPCEEIAVIGEPILVPLPAADEPRPPNVILLSLDTLRADRLGCYGYRRPDGELTSPHLDRFAERCTVFRQTCSVAPYTLPSHATMMTGLYPSSHGVMKYDQILVSGVHPLLAEQFAQAGYLTAGFTAGAFVSYEHGFHHGFDQYSILDPFLTEEDPFRNVFPRRDQRAFNDAMFARYDRRAIERWIGARGKRPFFLFLHSYVAHNYRPPRDLLVRFVKDDPAQLLGPDQDLHQIDVDAALAGAPLRPEVLEMLQNLYDATIRAADREVGALLQFLEGEGLLENTVIAITSDHGEEFGEHGGLLHGRSLYEEVVRVPLLIYRPGKPAREVFEPVDLADLAPTLLDSAGLPLPEFRDGQSLWRRLADRGYRPRGWAEVDAPNLTTRFAWYSGAHKLLFNPSDAREVGGFESRRPPDYELYDLKADPGELDNLLRSAPGSPLQVLPAGEQPRAFSSLAEELRAFKAGLDERRGRHLTEEALKGSGLSAEQRALMRAIGYIIGPPDDE